MHRPGGHGLGPNGAVVVVIVLDDARQQTAYADAVDVYKRQLRSFVRQVCAYKVLKPKVAVSVPASITEVERRSAVEAAMASGARRAVLIEESVAAAIGAGVDVAAPRGCMVADIGGGTTDAAVLTLKGMASSVSLRKGGDDLDEAIVRYVHNRYGLIIGRQTAEQMKIAIGTADPDQTGEETMPVKGRDAVKGLPRTREISAREVYEAMEEPLDEIISSPVSYTHLDVYKRQGRGNYSTG